jgi:hypothetical protein
LAVEGAGFSDRVLVAFDPDKDPTLRSTDGEEFSFRDHGHIRITAQGVTVRGPVSAFRVRAPGTDSLPVTVNGKRQEAQREGEFLVFGKPSPSGGSVRARDAGAENPAEQEAAVHYSFLPEEVHLRAGGAGQTGLHLRCVGQGKAQGRLRLTTPPGITVEPGSVDVSGMAEGEEKVVPLQLKADAGAATGLHPVRIEPDGGAAAAAGELVVSVGVVMTEEKRVPLTAQWVVRAPGYTMMVDQLSGVCYCLLDADGHRRHGRLHNTNFCYGIGALERGGRWAFRYGTPCRFVWEGKNTLTVGSAADNEQARLRYTFHEDRVVLALIPPTHPEREYTLWLGNFDALGKPRHNGTQKQPHEPITAGWLFFPHPVHRQGVLLVVPPKTPLANRGSAVNFPLRAGQEVVLRFATEQELPRLIKGN